jgi:hypothetical protein
MSRREAGVTVAGSLQKEDIAVPASAAKISPASQCAGYGVWGLRPQERILDQNIVHRGDDFGRNSAF